MSGMGDLVVDVEPRLGLYVHLPFCPQRCPYCAFAVVTGRDTEADRYVDAVCAEIAAWAHLAPRGGLDTVFFGGGTPTRLTPAHVGRVLEAAARHLGLRPGAEVTVEANPTTADEARLPALRRAGCTRLSLGVQALRDASLRRLGRMHGAADAERAYGVARGAGFDSVSIDLIFSIPGARADDWAATLERAVSLAPDHVSAYALSVEPGTPFARRRDAGDLPEVDEDDDAAGWERLVQVLGEAGYEHYEISNFARPGHRCQHNWDCWTGADYVGVGMSAHSCLAGRRFWNTADLDGYLAAVEAGRTAVAGEETLPAAAARREGLWLALRTVEGAALTSAEWLRLRVSSLWPRLCAEGQAREAAGRVRLTESGFARADTIAVALGELVAPDEGGRGGTAGDGAAVVDPAAAGDAGSTGAGQGLASRRQAPPRVPAPLETAGARP